MNEAAPKFELQHTLLAEDAALEMLGDDRERLGQRTMDAKAQVVAEFTKSIRVPGYFPPLPELRQQLRTMVDLLDEPAPELAKIEDFAVPGPAGESPARLYRGSAEPDPLPVLAYFHGGGFVQGDLDTHHGLCARLALWSGAMVVAFDYRLAPEHKFPAAVEDSFAAYTWLRNHGAAIGGDNSRVAVAGDSAGGNLAAVVCQQARESGRPVPAFQVLIYPALDLATDTASHAALVDGAIITRDRIDWYMAQYLGDPSDKSDLRASPLRAASLAGLPPALIISGGFDPLRDEAKAYGDRLVEAGVDVVAHEYTGQIHAFVSLTKAIPEGLEATREIADYVRRRFGLVAG